jgi:hypothetical protein
LKPSVALVPLLIANCHWLASGVGAIVYPDRDSFARFDLRLGLLPYALIVTVVFIWVVLLDWLFRRGGADLLAGASSVVQGLNLPRSASSVKLMAVACVCGGVMGLFAIVLAATETPH